MSTYGTRDVPTHRAPPRRLRAAAITAVAVLTATLAAAGGKIWWATHHVPAPLITAQQHLGQQLDQAFAEQTKPGPRAGLPGYALARLWLPTLGLRLVVVEGVPAVGKLIDDASLGSGPAHYPGSAMPGAVGNFAIAGHRSPGVFIHLDRLKPGDPVVVELADTWVVYRVTSRRVVPPTALAEVAEVPPGMSAGRLLTLTTCDPVTDNTARLIVHALLVRSSPHAQKPPELETPR